MYILLYIFWFISDNVDETDEDEIINIEQTDESQGDYQSSPSTSTVDSIPSSPV